MKEDSQNIIVVANMGEDTVSVIDARNIKVLYKIGLNNGIFHPNMQAAKKPVLGTHHIVMDTKEKLLYTTNSHHGSISIIDLNKCRVVDNIFKSSCPSHMEICHRNKTLYISNTDSNSISAMDLDTRILSTQIPAGKCPMISS